jgi:hypothetical protein
MRQKTLFWDFFGPAAEQTARHFMKHLDEFLVRNGCVGAVSGLSSEGDGHQAVWCRPSAEDELAIERSLRPRRVQVTGTE